MNKDQKFTSLLSLGKPIGEVIVAIISMVAILKDDIFSGHVPVWLKVLAAVFGGIAALIILSSAYGILDYFIDINLFKNSKTTRKIRKHIRQLKRLCRKCASSFKKNMKKVDNGDAFYASTVLGKKRLITKDKNSPEINAQSLCDINKGISKRDRKEFLSNASSCDQAKKVLTDAILDIDHILLNTNQLHSRIFFGKFLANNSNYFITRMRAKIDLLGWTYALLGKRKACLTIIQSALGELDEHEPKLAKIKKDSSEKDKKAVFDFYKYKTRAYRHLAANPEIRRDMKDGGIEFVNKAKDAFNKLNSYSECFSVEQKRDIIKNSYGIIFGEAEYAYDKLKKYTKMNPSERVNTSKECIEALQKMHEPQTYVNDKNKNVSVTLEEIDKHRYINTNLLENKFYFLLRKIYGHAPDSEEIGKYLTQFANRLGNEKKRVKDNIDNSAKILSGAIYVDQAIETYIQQRVFEAYKDVGKIRKIKFGEDLTKGKQK